MSTAKERGCFCVYGAYGGGVWERERERGDSQHRHLSMLGVSMLGVRDRNGMLPDVDRGCFSMKDPYSIGRRLIRP